MKWVASTLHTTSEHGVSSITTADVHTSAASSRLNDAPRRFKSTRPFRLKTKTGFCACAITFSACVPSHFERSVWFPLARPDQPQQLVVCPQYVVPNITSASCHCVCLKFLFSVWTQSTFSKVQPTRCNVPSIYLFL
jgi:hypothetical protein